VSPFALVFAEAIHGNVHQHRDEMRNQHFFAPEYGSKYLMPFTIFTPFANWKQRKIVLLIICNIHQYISSSPVAEDDYAIDIFSFGICALEV